MRHVTLISVRRQPMLATLPLEVKLNGIIDIMDRLLLAQRQSAWKTPWPIDSNNTDNNTTDVNTTI